MAAITLTSRQTFTSDTDATSYVSTSYTPTASRLLVAFIQTTGTNSTPTVTGNGLTWTLIQSINQSGTARLMLYAVLSGSSPTATGLTADYGVTTQTGQQMSIFELANVDMSAGEVAAFANTKTGSGTATSGTITLTDNSGLVAHSGNLCLSGWAHAANEATNPKPASATQDAWTEVHDVTGATPATGLETQWRSDRFDKTGIASWTTSSVWGGIVAEVRNGPGTISTDFTIIDTADVTTGWITLGTWATAPALNNDLLTENVTAVTSGNAIIARSSISGNTSSFSLAATSAGLNLSTGNHLFAWIKNTTWPATDSKANGGLRICISSDTAPTRSGTGPTDGPTNSKSWFVGGYDQQYAEGWVCYVVDPTGTSDLSIGTPDMTSVDRAGLGARMLNTVGAGSVKPTNIIYDVIKYGKGLTIKDGNGVSPVTSLDIADTDSKLYTAYGVMTQLSSTFFLGGELNIGTTGQTSETIFKDTSKSWVWQDFPVNSSFYKIVVNGASGQETTFQLGNYTPSTDLTSSGVTIKGAGNVSGTSRLDGVLWTNVHSVWTLTASAANQVTRLYNCTFTEMLSAALAYNTVSPTVTNCVSSNGSPTLTTTTANGFTASGIVVGMSITGTNIPANTYVSSIASSTSLTMSNNATGNIGGTATFSHSSEVRGCTFSNSGAVTTNGCVIDNCIFQDVKTGASISATYAVIVASSTEGNRITNSKFINCNRAIKITASGSYTFNNLTFSGNSYDVENSASSGTVLISATNGSDPGTYAYINTGISFEASAAQSYNANTTTYTNEATDIGNATVNDVALPPIQATTAGDAIYLGHSATFTGVTLVLGTKGIYSGVTLQWQYWNGAWTAISDVVDNTSFFTAVAGTYTINFQDPIDNADWATTSVNGTTKYWIRCVVTTMSSPSITTAPLGTQAWHGYTKINNTVTLTVTVKDTSGTAVSGARVRIETSGGTLISNGTTNGSGIYSDATYSYGGDVAVNIVVRLKGYINFKTTGTIEASGLSVGVRFIRDEIVNLP